MDVKLSSQQTCQNSVIKILRGGAGIWGGLWLEFGEGWAPSLANPVAALTWSSSLSRGRPFKPRGMPRLPPATRPPGPTPSPVHRCAPAHGGQQRGPLVLLASDLRGSYCPVMGEGSRKDYTEVKSLLWEGPHRTEGGGRSRPRGSRSDRTG